MYKITKREQLNADVFSIKIEAPRVANNFLAGNFVIVRANETGERVPLTVVNVDKQTGEVELIIQALGYSTKILSMLKAGDYLADIMGPLGQPVPIHKEFKRVLGVAGGVGAAPLFPQLEAYKKAGVSVELIIGGRTDKHLLLIDRFEKICDKIHICTNDGSKGRQGFVSDVLIELLEKDASYFDEVITIGPAVMMRAVVDITKKYQVKTGVSLNPIMVDGTGMCGECRVMINGKVKFACVDGPDFDGFSVDFDELMNRQKQFKNEEDHICKLKLGGK